MSAAASWAKPSVRRLVPALKVWDRVMRAGATAAMSRSKFSVRPGPTTNPVSRWRKPRVCWRVSARLAARRPRRCSLPRHYCARLRWKLSIWSSCSREICASVCAKDWSKMQSPGPSNNRWPRSRWLTCCAAISVRPRCGRAPVICKM